MPTSLEILKACAPLMDMLKDENRQKIVVLLCENEALTVNEITERMELSRPAVSHHLKLLLDKDIVFVRKVGKEHYYSIHLECLYNGLKNLTDNIAKELEKRGNKNG